ncbi:MAG: preprotein translocase subunit SecG [Acidobacteria bacterium]|nr:MAG: preprotein translocase subunit SecG [Acidobacteriota bacterium]PYR79433.1 MAG: preprotein translocase subunit SecG [Acidobacteriota bacterium]
MVFYFVTALYVFVCFTMMLVVYLQQGKGGDIASAFGGGSSQAAFGARSGATVLSRATWICAAAFIIGALALGILGKQGPGSVLGGRTPLTQPSGPTPSPLNQAVPGPKAPTPPRTAPAPAAPAAPAAPK